MPEAMSESTTPPDQPQPEPAPPPTGSGLESRQDLLSRAQAFLTSPQIRDQDDAAKRKFLTEKGLTPAEVDHLLQGIVSVWAPTTPRRFRVLIPLVLLTVAAVYDTQCSPTIVPSTAAIEFAYPTRGRAQDFYMASRRIRYAGPNILRM